MSKHMEGRVSSELLKELIPFLNSKELNVAFKVYNVALGHNVGIEDCKVLVIYSTMEELKKRESGR